MESDENLMKKTTLLEECMNAFKYASEVVHRGSPIREDLCESCADVCRTCAEDCLKLDGTEESRFYQMCMEYTTLCEELKELR